VQIQNRNYSHMEKQNSKFKKGQSGNPAGRPRGQTTGAKLREQLATDIPPILRTLVKQALDGDVQAARLVLDRALPSLRPVDLPEPVAIGGDSLSDQGRAVFAAIGAGEVSISHGATLIGALSGLAKIHEVSELQSRIEKLEART
jgi:hypothetical protein